MVMRSRIATVGALVLNGFLLACVTTAGLAAAPSVDLSAAIDKAKAAKSTFTPITDDEFAAARKELDSATRDLSGWLSRNRQKAQGWKTYLKWEVMEEQLAAGEGGIQKELETVLAQYSKAEAIGLSMPRFIAVRQALRKYIDAFYVKTNPGVEKHFAVQLDTLAAALQAYTNQPSTDVAAAIGARLDYLDRTGQAPELVEEIRGTFSEPNLKVVASRDFLMERLERDVEETAPIYDVIMGTSIRGTGHTSGRVAGRLIQQDDAAVLELELTGINRSRNVGRNGPVTIHSRGVTNVYASKQVHIDADGLHAQPACASCNTNSTITSICARCRMIEKAAWRRAGKQKGQVERVAARHAANKVASRFNSEVREALAEVEEKYQEQFRKPLLRKGEFPQVFDLSSTEEAILVTAMQANGAQLGSPTPAPDAAADVDVSVRVHESLAGNASEAVIGGITLTDERLAEILEERTGEVPEELQIKEDKDPWSITFARRQPVVVKIGDNSLRIAVRGSKFTRGDTEMLEALEISASYSLERTPTGSKLTRQGDVEVEFLRSQGKQLGIRQITFKTFMQKKFAAMFKEEFVGKGLELPGQDGDDIKLNLAQMDSGSGWIALGWNVAPEPEVQGAE
jgi:hypothetical protein